MDDIISVKEVVWPAQGKKQGQVIDSKGNKWYVFADKIGQFRAGYNYRITDTASSEFKGQTYVTLKAWEQVGGASMSPANGAKPAPAQQHTMDHERRMDIFVCGCVNAMMSHPSIDPLTLNGTQLIDQINKLKYVWKMTLGPSAPQPPLKRGGVDDEMSDSIPF